MAKDFYAILGVNKSASDSEIKQAYRKLSRELHPDKHKGDKTKEAKFKEVNEAYEVLSDEKKKAAYDRFGSADYANMGQGGGGFGGFSGFQGFDPSQFENMGGFGDIFESFFSGTQRGRQGKTSGRGRTMEIEITINFMDAVRGLERELSFRTQVLCDDCGGKGAMSGSAMKDCGECGGTGAVERTARSLFGMVRQNVVCEKCQGSGKVPEKPCKTCHGEGRTEREKRVNVRIPAGIDDGQSLRLKGEGEMGRQGMESGDLLVRVHVESDARFERDGDDIRSSLSISIVDAVLGADQEIETVHGKTTISIPAGTQPGQILRIKHKGMPVVNTSRTGDHYITLDIVVPTKLSKEERRLFEELRKKYIS
jgi:molecular chaperone DnaJ